MSEADPAQAVLTLATAYWASRCLHVAAEFGVADLLGDEPETAVALAGKLGLHPQTLGRVLRALASHGVFVEQPDGRFAHTPASRTLRGDFPTPMRGLARMMGLEFHWAAYGKIEHSLRTGQPAAAEVAEGGIFGHFAAHPEDARIFDEAMTGKAFSQIGPVLQAYDFKGFATIGDIGGGAGHLLSAVLDTAPGAKGVLFDLPHVVDRARERADPRVTYVGGDFFNDPIPACDAYLMMTVLHDWSDEEAVAILRNLRKDAPAAARLVIVEGVIEPGRVGDFTADLDIEMLVMTTGRERTGAEWGAVLTEAGFRLTRIVPCGGWSAVVEAELG